MQTQPITERVKDINDILAIAGKTMEQVTAGCEDEQEEGNRLAKLIAKVYNEDVVLDPMNTDQWKYFPWPRIDPESGFGLSYPVCDRWASTTTVGVRLCFHRPELAIDAFKKCPEVYAKLLIR